jgi:hypothetical protein
MIDQIIYAAGCFWLGSIVFGLSALALIGAVEALGFRR